MDIHSSKTFMLVNFQKVGPGMVAYTLNPSIEGRGRRISELRARLVYISKFQGYIVRPYLKKRKTLVQLK